MHSREGTRKKSIKKNLLPYNIHVHNLMETLSSQEGYNNNARELRVNTTNEKKSEEKDNLSSKLHE